MRRAIGGRAARGVTYLIQLYRHTVSPLRLPTCRFVPTCSEYAVDALSEFGLLRGGWLAVVRLCKCGPWHRGGWDPIPERRGTAAGAPAAGEDRATAAVRDETRAVRSGSETRV